MEFMWVLLFTVSFTLIDNVIWGSEHHYQLSIKKECPAIEDIPKCTCQESTSSFSSGLIVSCKHFETDGDFQNHLKVLQGFPLKKLHINKYKSSSIPTTLWKGQDIKELWLENMEVEDASFRKDQRHFQGLETSLESLEIENSFRNGHRPLLNLKLDHLQNLKSIVMEKNLIPEVGNDWFASGPNKLATLIFEKNGIEELGDRTFSSLSSLKLLAVSGNHLRLISREMLPQPANVLITLDLSYNKIHTLPKDIFSSMPSLQFVNIEYNLIHVIQKDTWDSIYSQLTVLHLQGNVLQCNENMQWICDTNMKTADGQCSSPVEKSGLSLQQFCKL